MKNIFITILCFLSINCTAQLYVSSNSYLYVKDRVLFVNQDINLQNNGFVYLRNESQLVQGLATTTSTNRGQGKVSLFQEGTSDNFDYNYWCSPVGNSSTTTGNENFGILMLNSPTSVTASTPAVALPLSNYNGTSQPLQIASRWIYKFVNSTNYSQWLFLGANPSLLPGEGFTMKGTSGTDTTVIEGNTIQNNPGSAQRYDFRGKPNNGTIPVSVLTNNYTLTGNPYPSAMNVSAFLLDPSNAAGTGIAYYYENDKNVNSHLVVQYRGGYGTFAPGDPATNGIYTPATFNSYNDDGSLNSIGPSSGAVYQRKFAPIGQGFMIHGAATGTVSLKNSYRVYYKESNTLSHFERVATNADSNTSPQDTTSVEIPHLRINTILNNQFTRQIALAFLPQATDSIDRGIDAKNMTTDLPTDAYFFLEEEPYIIQGIAFEQSKRIKLGVKSGGNSTFKFYIAEVINFDENQDIYVYDALDNSYHDIKNGTYEVTIPAGVFNNRFEITFLSETLGTPELSNQNFIVTQNLALQKLNILNPNLASVQTIQLYDISGKRIYESKKLDVSESYSISTEALSEGVYILNLTTSDNLKFSQKVIISKLKS